MSHIIEAGRLVLQAQEDQGDRIVLDGRARALLRESLRRLETQEDAKRVAQAAEHHGLLVGHLWFQHRNLCPVCRLGQDCLEDTELRAQTHLWLDRMRAIREEIDHETR